jgi:hypothetical protein
MVDAFSILLSRLLQQPHGCKFGRGPAAALPTSRYAHLAKHKIVMRPTGEASKPDLSISIAVFFPALRHRFYAAASQSVLAPGFRGDAPVRVDSVTTS